MRLGRFGELKPAGRSAALAALLLLLSHQLLAEARHLPRHRHLVDSMSHRQDLDGDSYADDMDQTASAPYQSQDEGADSGRPADGFDDNEPESNYDESPNEREGQADLERFFDDHLGASEREGMDKENLPSELVLQLAEAPQQQQQQQVGNLPELRPVVAEAHMVPIELPDGLQVELPKVQPPPVSKRWSHPQHHHPHAHQQQLLESFESQPTISTSYIQLPDKKLIITRQTITRPRGPLRYEQDNDLGDQLTRQPPEQLLERHSELQPKSESWQGGVVGRERPVDTGPGKTIETRDGLDARGSHVVVSEDDEFDRVYVTNATNKPFRIAALGGFDPEEDFIDASRDIEESTRRDTAAGVPQTRQTTDSRRRKAGSGHDHGSDGKSRDGADAAGAREISFNDPETDQLFEDASEKDEITFGQDDPYQTDLEAEMRHQAYDKIGEFGADPVGADSARAPDEQLDERPEVGAASSAVQSGAGLLVAQRRGADNDDDEGGWANDGVEDMEVPSQSHQDEVLAKANEAQARREAQNLAGDRDREQPPAATDDDEAGGGGAGEREGEENVRMPNANYLMSDLRRDDSGYRS